MGPSKRKGSVRRQVLDLNTKESSPSRPTWQNKYQHVLPGDGVHQNGDTQSSSSTVETKQNPLSGLLGNYNSDSDGEDVDQPKNSNLDAKVEDFLKEIQSISSEQPSTQSQPAVAQKSEEQAETYYPSSIPWQQCYDHNSGYPYYWNTETNEVTWEMPTELKAAIAEVALQQQKKDEQATKQPQTSEPVKETKKKVCKYPWQTESDSEDEKIEMITSFGPQSDEESEEEKVKKKKLRKKALNSVGPQLPKGALPGFKGSISLAPEDLEGLNESSYETSSLLTHGVQDTGPPGDESFHAVKELIKAPVTSSKESSAISQSKNEISKIQISHDKLKSYVGDDLPNEGTKAKVEKSKESPLETVIEKTNLKESISIADEVIAQIEMETPPDYSDELKPEKEAEIQGSDNSRVDPDPTNSQQSSVTNSQTPSGIALLANYDDDSETEEAGVVEKRITTSEPSSAGKPLFPIEIPQDKVKPLFPCMGVVEGPKAPVEFRVKEPTHEEPETVNNIYKAEMDLENPAAMKAFKRKKRIEFATTTYSPSISKMADGKGASPERSVVCPSTQYNMDPNSNEHRGFGFSSLNTSVTDSERKTYKSYGGIQFIKAETINLSNEAEMKEKMETGTDNSGSLEVGGAKESVRKEEIEDSATLLREKVTFLTEGTGVIPPIQQMAIELETLVLAWQQGALAPTYLLRWLNEKCGELIRHEKTAAPPGWTCLWDRKNKRYYYRNKVTKAIQWEYPNVEEKVKEVTTEEGGEEMDICDTPPQASSPVELEKQEEPPSTPPPPVISEVSESCVSPTPQAPPPPHISFCSEGDSSSSKIIKKKKRKAKEMEEDREGHMNVTPVANPASVIAYDQNCENTEPAPPLPPVPPPPPPPPDESPPPLPNSPPPMSLDPDQPLPPGVDEPEYSLYRRVSPKHSYKKAQSDSSAYSAELMMTYGYGLPVQQVVPTNGSAMALQMQPMEYHSYLHDPVANHYLVQSAPTTSQVIQCRAKKSKPSLTSELVSFYSDLAMLDSATENSSNASVSKPVVITAEPVTKTTTSPERAVTKTDSPNHRPRRKSESSPVNTPPTSTSPVHVPSTVPTTTSSVVATSTKVKEEATSNGVTTTKKKEKKKVKPTTGLAMKKKGVSSLVAKWQQLQQEVRRDYSDDEEDGL